MKIVLIVLALCFMAVSFTIPGCTVTIPRPTR